MFKNLLFVLIAALISTLALAQVQQFTGPILVSSGVDTGDIVRVDATAAVTRSGATTLPKPPPVTGNQLGALESQVVGERNLLTYLIPVTDPNARVFLEDLPPGATFNEATRMLSFFPDFTQSGDYTVKIKAYGANKASEGTFLIRVNNTIVPPDPVVIKEKKLWKAKRYDIELTSDGFLDPAGVAGKKYSLAVVVPDAASDTKKMPLRIFLHGSGGKGSAGQGHGGRFSFGPHEPFVGWHTGQHSDYPNAATASSTVPNTTQRKALHILDWITRTFPGVDRDRVDVSGSSMGASGAMFFTARYGYHVAEARGVNGMTSMRQASAYQRRQMEQYWGSQSLNLKDDLGMSVWDRFDLPRALRDDEHTRNVFFYTKNGAQDATIEFHHTSTKSPVTGVSWAESLQSLGVGHRMFWHQGGHGTRDTAMADAFWPGTGRSSLAKIARNKAFPAFSNSSLDKDPPVFDSNTAIFSGNDPRGGRNRHLAWVSDSIVDEHASFEIPLFVVTQAPNPEQGLNLPVYGEGYSGAFPVTVDVTLRRVQRFKGLPGEVIPWTFGSQSGNVTVAANGDIKITGLNLTATQQTLTLSRTL